MSAVTAANLTDNSSVLRSVLAFCHTHHHYRAGSPFMHPSYFWFMFSLMIFIRLLAITYLTMLTFLSFLLILHTSAPCNKHTWRCSLGAQVFQKILASTDSISSEAYSHGICALVESTFSNAYSSLPISAWKRAMRVSKRSMDFLFLSYQICLFLVAELDQSSLSVHVVQYVILTRLALNLKKVSWEVSCRHVYKREFM